MLMILKDGKELEHTAQTLHRCTNWVRKWVDRFEEHGLMASTISQRVEDQELSQRKEWIQ